MNPITIAVRGIRCNQENDFGPGSDEPYVLATVVDLRTVPPQLEVTLYGPWGDVDKGETHTTLLNSGLGVPVPGWFESSPLSRRPCWSLDNKHGKRITNPEDVIIVVSMLEHDDGSASGARAVAKAAGVASLVATMQMSRAQRVHKLIADIDDGLKGITSFPDLGIFTPDDRIGNSQELQLTSSDLAFASQNRATSDLHFVSSSGSYDVYFELKNALDFDDVVLWNNGKAYFFVGDQYYAYDVAGDTVVPGYPKPILGNWPGLWFDGIDAGTVWDNGKAYFFKGGQYIRYDLAADKADPGYPKPIAGNWPGLWLDGIDAAVLWNNGKAYFFKGGQYIRYDLAADKADPGYPKPIAEPWQGLWSDGIDAAVLWNNDKAYFFKDGQYVRYDLAADAVDQGYPRVTGDNWPGF